MSEKQKQDHLHGQLVCFMQRYARKAHAGHDPNDRRYDRKLEPTMQRMRPELLSDLLTGDDVEDQIEDTGASRRD